MVSEGYAAVNNVSEHTRLRARQATYMFKKRRLLSDEEWMIREKPETDREGES